MEENRTKKNESEPMDIDPDAILEIHNTDECEIQYIKILSNNRYWCVICSRIEVLRINNKKRLSNIISHTKSNKHKNK